MKTWILVPVFLVAAALNGVAQLNFADMGGAHFKGTGRTGITQEGIGALYYNQAGLHSVLNWGADVSVERKFNVNDLNSIQVGAVKRFGFGTLGIVFSQFGTSEYNEQLYGVAYGRTLSRVISFGGILAITGFNSSHFGSSYVPAIGLGSVIRISKEFSVGVHLFNPVQLRITDHNITSARYRMGLAYQPSEKVKLMAEMNKDLARASWEFCMGISYQIVEILGIQAGFNPTAEFFAFGLKYNPRKNVVVRGAGSVHQVLGFSPALSLSYGE